MQPVVTASASAIGINRSAVFMGSALLPTVNGNAIRMSKIKAARLRAALRFVQLDCYFFRSIRAYVQRRSQRYRFVFQKLANNVRKFPCVTADRFDALCF